MAEAYRGLTIKIGADTTKLQRAMNNLRTAMSAVAADGRKLEKALATNPRSVELAESRVKQLGAESRVSATQVATLRRSLDEAGHAGKSAADIFKRFANSDLNLANIRNSFSNLNEQLEKTWDRLRRFIADTDDVNSQEWKEAAEYVKQLKTQLSNAERELSQMGERTAENAEKWDKWASKANEVKNAIKSAFAGVKSLPYGAKNVDELIGAFDNLRVAQKKQQRQLEAANKNVGIKNAAADMLVFEERTRAANAQMTEMLAKQQQLGTGKIREAASNMERLEESARDAKSTIDAMDEALKVNPHNLDAVRMRMQAVSQQIELTSNALNEAKSRMTALGGAEGSVERLTKKYTSLAHAVRETGNTRTNLATEVDNVRGKIKDTIASAKQLRQAMKTGNATKEQAADYQKITEKAKQLRHELVTVRQEAKNANRVFKEANEAKAYEDARKDVVRLETELKKLNAVAKTSGNGLQAVGHSIRQIGYGMYSSISMYSMMAAMYAVQAADDVDSAYRDMRKTVNGTEEQFEHLKNAALDYSRTHVTSSDQILEIESIGGQLGIAADDLEAFATTVSNLDIATNMDTEDIALDLAKLSNIMHFGQDQYDSFADALVRLGNNEPALESDIMRISTRFAGMAANVGMSTSDMLAFATAATATGQKAEAAGGSMQRTIGRIETAVAKGGKSLNGFAQVAGMSAAEFAGVWGDKENHGPARALQAFFEGLKNIHDRGGSVTKTLEDLGITGVRDKQLLEGLSNTTNVLAESLQMADDAWNGTATTIKGSTEQAGDAAREAGRKAEGFSGQLQILKNNAQALAAVMTDASTPVVKMFGTAVASATEAISAMPDSAKLAIMGIGGLAAASGPLLVGMGTIVQYGSKFAKWAVLAKNSFKLVGMAARDGAAGVEVAKNALAAGGGGIFAKTSLRIQELGEKAFYTGVNMESMGKRGAKGMQRIGTVMSKLTPGALLGITAAITAVTIAIGIAVSKYQEWQEHVKKVEESHRTMSERIGEAMMKTATSVDAANTRSVKSLDEIREAYDKWLDETAEAHERLGEKAQQAWSDSSLIDNYADSITSLMDAINNGDYSESNFNELKSKIEAYNEATGDSIKVTYDETNGLKVMRGETELTAKSFDELANSMENAAKASYFQEEYKEAYKSFQDTQKQIADVEKKMQEIREGSGKSYGAALDMTPQERMAAGYANLGNDEVVKQYDALKVRLKELEGANKDNYAAMKLSEEMSAILGSDAAKQAGTYANLIATTDTLTASFEANGVSARDFLDALEGTGVSSKKLVKSGKLTGAVLEEMVGKWDGSAEGMRKLLEGLGVDFGNLANNSAVSSKKVSKALEGTGKSSKDFRAALEKAGIETDNLAGISSGKLAKWVKESGGDFDKVIAKINEYNEKELKDKEAKVTVFTESLVDALGNEYEWNDGKLVDKHGKVAVDGVELEDANGMMWVWNGTELVPKTTTANVNAGQLVSATGDIWTWNETDLEWKKTEVSADTSKAKKEVASTKKQIDGTKAKISVDADTRSGKKSVSSFQAWTNTATAYIKVDAATSLAKNAIDRLLIYAKNKKATVSVKTKSATGSVSNSQFIPQHASGYIAAGPTLTNNGWVGEAGAEWVQNWATGGMVVPLTNRQYMLPIADAIADGIYSRGGGAPTVNVYATLDYTAGDTAKDMARDLAREVRLAMGRM